jgi:zinc finger HIT domain-containing protein 1
VRRILAYSRTFQHYLADEEAGVNVYGAAGNVVGGAAATAPETIKTTPADGGGGAKKKGGAAATKKPSRTAAATAARLKKSAAAAVKDERVDDGDGDVGMPDATTGPSTTSEPAQPPPRQTPGSSSGVAPFPPAGALPSASSPADLAALDRDPLLRTRDVPKMPSERVMRALLAEPPLSYTAARARPEEGDDDDKYRNAAARPPTRSSQPPPPRHFCHICGHLGKLRCGRSCGERVCGLLDCWRAHEAVCPLAAY